MAATSSQLSPPSKIKKSASPDRPRIERSPGERVRACGTAWSKRCALACLLVRGSQVATVAWCTSTRSQPAGPVDASSELTRAEGSLSELPLSTYIRNHATLKLRERHHDTLELRDRLSLVCWHRLGDECARRVLGQPWLHLAHIFRLRPHEKILLRGLRNGSNCRTHTMAAVSTGKECSGTSVCLAHHTRKAPTHLQT